MRDIIFNFLYDSASEVTPLVVLENLSAATLLAIVLFFTYRITFCGVVYSKKFNISLIMLTVISAMVMSIIASSVALSLGMVGALSIVRFRTAVKDPRDTAYIFWAISIGLGTGSGNYYIVGIGTLFVAALSITMSFGLKGDDKYLVIVRGELAAMEEVRSALFNSYRAGKLRAETVTDTYAEIVYQVKLKKDSKVVDYEKIRSIQGVDYVNLVAQNGETLG